MFGLVRCCDGLTLDSGCGYTYLRCVLSSKNFLLLIGSFARGNATRRSDIDLVAIGTPKLSGAVQKLPTKRKVNLVKFERERFEKLYRKGDLFVFHILQEGVLLRGNTKEWARLKSDFRVRTSFKREIKKNRNVIIFLLSDRGNLEAPIAFLSNFLRSLKQIAIFRLAEVRDYEFAKDVAIARVFPWIPKRILTAMLDAEHILTRETASNRDHELRRLTDRARDLFDVATINQKELLW